MKNPMKNGFVGHDKPVKSILKTAAEIIAAYERFMNADRLVALMIFDIVLMAVLVLKGGI